MDVGECKRRRLRFVMAGQKREARLAHVRADVPAIHVLAIGKKGVDTRDKPGHDEQLAGIFRLNPNRTRTADSALSSSLNHNTASKPANEEHA
jgi:hypothetical protein